MKEEKKKNTASEYWIERRTAEQLELPYNAITAICC